MDLNLVVIAGRLAAEPEMKEYEQGTRSTRLLVTVRQKVPKPRMDVIPVMCWDMDLPDMDRGTRVWVAGQIQRRFRAGPVAERQSRVEVVAVHVEANPDEDTMDNTEAALFEGRIP